MATQKEDGFEARADEHEVEDGKMDLEEYYTDQTVRCAYDCTKKTTWSHFCWNFEVYPMTDVYVARLSFECQCVLKYCAQLISAIACASSSPWIMYTLCIITLAPMQSHIASWAFQQ